MIEKTRRRARGGAIQAFEFNAARNRTSHTSSEATAQVVFETIPSFVAEVEHLLARVDEIARRLDETA